jgi:hypothetical protein
VEVRETHTAGSQFDGKRFRIWKEQRFESAVPFDSNGNYTGHSYLVRLMLTGSLDRTMGWLLDLAMSKTASNPSTASWTTTRWTSWLACVTATASRWPNGCMPTCRRWCRSWHAST